jgi:hypothetical protein
VEALLEVGVGQFAIPQMERLKTIALRNRAKWVY